MNEISKALKLQLRAQAHHLKPIVILGNKGLTDAVDLEIERGLLDHELIKIRINVEDKDEFKKVIEQICASHDAALIQTIGRIAVIYRENDED